MPTIADEAVCIRHWDFSETSQTVSLFAREHGILRGLAKGAKRAGGRFSGGIDLLTSGQIVAIVKPGRELATLTDWTLLRAWRSIRHDLAANQTAYYFADLIQRLLPAADPHPALFDALTEALDALDEPAVAPGVLLAFQSWILDEVGLAPRLDAPASLGATLHFSAEDGGIGPVERAGSWKVRRQTIELLVEVAAAELFRAALHRAAAAPPERVMRANRLLAAYLRHALGVQPETMRLLYPDL